MPRSLFARLHRIFGSKLSAPERRRRLENKLNQINKMFESERQQAAAAPHQAARRPHIVVVGGGFAGLYAAAHLMADPPYAGRYDVTLLEARDQVGGRVRSVKDLARGRLIEEGAELIGLTHPLWLHLCQKFNLGLAWLTTEDNFYAIGLDTPLYLGGKLVGPDEQRNLYREMKEVLSRMSKEAVRCVVDPDRPWLALDAEKLDKTPLSVWIAEQSCSPLLKMALEVQFENDNGLRTSEQSLLANFALLAGAARRGKPDDFWNFTEVARCSSGNQALATALARHIKENGGSVQLSTPVSKIAIREGKGVYVHTGGKMPLHADYVILAVPPSVWNEIVLDHDICAQGRTGMADVIKYFSTVKSRFWLKKGHAPCAIGDTFGMTWEGTDNQIGPLRSEYVLSLFAGGRAAAEAIAYAGEYEDHYRKLLEQVYPGYGDNLKRSRFVNWPSESWTRGGYSCPRPGEVCGAGKFLNQPFKGRLVFAGEHVSMAFFGYMEGALRSGMMASDRIEKLEHERLSREQGNAIAAEHGAHRTGRKTPRPR